MHPATVLRPTPFAVTVGTILLAIASTASAAVPFSIVIDQITQLTDGVDPGPFQTPVGEFYAQIRIDGTTYETPVFDRGPGLTTGVFFPWGPVYPPDMRAGADLADGTTSVAVQIGVLDWDAGDFVPEDPLDVNPAPGNDVLRLVVDLATGTWTGDLTYPDRCSQGNNDKQVRICFDVSLLSKTGDADGDGLPDPWEDQGVDLDGDGSPEIPLPSWGADPLHKDLFLEFDWTLPPGAAEPTGGPGSCFDGLDNDSNGWTDAEDPACRTGGAVPTQTEIRALKAAFCAAPIDAGGVSNPDGLPGINLWVDTGPLRDRGGSETSVRPCTCDNGADDDMDTLVDADDPDCLVHDASRTETSGAPGSCGDGVDNDGDGNIDAADPSCRILDAALAETPNGPGTCFDGNDNDTDGVIDLLDPDCVVGDDLGGGNPLPNPQMCGLDDLFYAAKRANFVPLRSSVFRYGLSAVQGTGCPASGGQAEIGGNDFVDFNGDPGTILHELGHTLDLRHGGDENRNCKPNYVSVMNYDLQFGIQQVLLDPTGGRDRCPFSFLPGIPVTRCVFDYSPPRRPGGRGIAPVAPLRRDDLRESAIPDPGDTANWFVFKDPGRIPRRWPLSGDGDNDGPGDGNGNGLGDGVDWNSDGDTDDPAAGLPLRVGINAAGSATGLPPYSPQGCLYDDDPFNPILTGHDDWPVIVLPFRRFGDSTDAAIRPVREPEPTAEELREQFVDLHTTDLAISLTADPVPVEVGAVLEYALEVRNEGLNPAVAAQVVARPSARTPVVDAPSCDPTGGVDLLCTTPPLLVSGRQRVGLSVDTSGVCVGGVAQPIVASAEVRPPLGLAETDLDPTNDVGSLSVESVDTTPPEVTPPADVVAECRSPAGTPVALGAASAQDVCDDDPEITNDAPALFDLGTTRVTWFAMDEAGLTGSAGQEVLVEDTTAPRISVELSPAVLWPPDHRLRTIRATVWVEDECDAAPAVRLISVRSDEPDDGTGDGKTLPDLQGAAEGTDDRVFELRAERNGEGIGRTYVVTYEAEDASGNRAPASASVRVPHDENE